MNFERKKTRSFSSNTRKSVFDYRQTHITPHSGVTNYPPRYEINQYSSVCTAVWRESFAAHQWLGENGFHVGIYLCFLTHFFNHK